MEDAPITEPLVDSEELSVTEIPPTSKIKAPQDHGVPGLFHPQEWDIEEEFQNNEALRDHLRSSFDDYI
jgi:hypothetical protein